MRLGQRGAHARAHAKEHELAVGVRAHPGPPDHATRARLDASGRVAVRPRLAPQTQWMGVRPPLGCLLVRSRISGRMQPHASASVWSFTPRSPNA